VSPDDEMLMAYADGELDPLAAKRVERAIVADAALAEAIAAHRALRARIGGAFAATAEESVPDRLTALLTPTVVPIQPRPGPSRRRWVEAAAIAATLVLGIAVGDRWRSGPVSVDRGALVASGSLAHALDTQLASNRLDSRGDTRMIASFRTASGDYCRVFSGAVLDGIACREDAGWTLRRARSAGRSGTTEYRQAASPDATLMAEAQEMMAGDPLGPAAEARARDLGWRRNR
jgi:hypothetical protein